MSESSQEGSLEDVGWRFDVDAEADELRVEHADSGNTYVFDSQGGLRVPGEGDVGGDVRELQATLSSALDADGDEPADAAEPADTDATEPPGVDESSDAGQSAAACSIECDESTGEVSIESDERISLDAPTIELSADSSVDVSGGSKLALSADGQLRIESGGLAALTAAGPMTIEGALIQLN